MNNIMDIKNVSKNYGKKIVLDDISFSLSKGQIVGLFGSNGSGKTTLIKIITGLLSDYKGSVLIDNKEIGIETKSVISYLPEKTYFNKNLNAKSIISIFNDFYSDFNIDKANDMLKNFSLSENQKISTMSKGMQEKLQLVMVMSREAKLYILDEPMGGVDPAARDYILDTIIKNYNENSSILITTHLIQDVERIFDKALFIKEGKIVINEYVDVLRDEKGKSLNEIFREVYKNVI